MKWIGQHIVDFIARFRSDVYLEEIANPGSDTDKFLVADATTGKVGFRTGANVLSDIGASSESTDLEFNGSTANGVLTYGGAAQIDVESGFKFNPSYGLATINSSVNAILSLTNTHASNVPAIAFQRTAVGDDGDGLGEIKWIGDDDGGEPLSTGFAKILGEIATAANGQEGGKLSLQVAAHDGGLENGLILEEGDVDAEVDVTIANGAASTTTIAGDLQVNGGDILGPTDGDLNIKSDGGVFLTLDTDTDENNQMFTIAETSGEGSFQYNAGRGALDISSSLSAYPTLTLTNTTDDFGGPFIALVNDRDGNGLEDNDILGTINFQGDDVAGGFEAYANIVGTVVEADHGDEAGQIAISVANDGTLRNGITMTADKGTPEEVDVTIANGAASTTTVAGGLVVTTGLPVVLSSEAQGQFGVQVARRTITTAEANAMNSVPIELVPAQGANTVIVLLGGMIRVDRAATQTEAACNLHIHYESEEPGTFGQSILYHHRRFMHNNTVDRVFHIHAGIAGGVPVTDSLTEDVDAAMEVSFDAAATLNCFTSIEVYITYQVISIA